MKIDASRRLRGIGSYAFAEVDKKVDELKAKGITPIDFGVGDPTAPTPQLIRQAAATGLELRKSSGYPSYIGDLQFRETVSSWVERRYGLKVDAQTEVSSTIGSKEAVFNFHEGIVDPGDIVLCPSPGYPPYTRGTLFAEGVPYQVPIRSTNGFLVDFSEIPEEVARKAKLLWLNYPNSPSGATADEIFYREAVEFARKYDIVIASDEAYSEIYFEEPPISILNIAREGVLVFNSLSKRSAMTGYRIGWVMGDADLVAIFRKVKTNIDSGTPTFIQDAAAAALEDEEHVEGFRREYRQKRDILCSALIAAGLEDCTPAATLYIWQRVPAGMSSLDFATLLLGERTAIVTTPGNWISEPTADGENVGEGYVRFALVPSLEDTHLAAERISALKLA
ncbi:MAG: aminotransferase class I/II-fold pyridoxal phosphate-dependent enzyme [Spirochaetaceae bacterium]|nr:MAG: aminotransferase class I/II-fold pyridoxal phosphate-dependent enzyme [Spirochaetaceae bacterium]